MKMQSGAVALCAATLVATLMWAPSAHAQVPGPVLGVSVRDAGADDIAKAKLPQAEGVVIQRVTQGSAADRAGLRAGDLVVEFDGERVRSARQFSRLVQDTPAGRTVRAVVVREGARRAVDVTPDPPKRAALDVPDLSRIQEQLGNLRFEIPDIDLAPYSSRRRLGTALEPLTGQLADYFGVKRGVLVSSVDVNSPAARAGLKAGDVITGVNGHDVDSPSDVRRELREAGTGAKIDLRVTRDHKPLTLSATN